MRQGLGFLVSSMRPDMFLRKRLCICFSSMSRSFVSRPTSTCSEHGGNTDNIQRRVDRTCGTGCWLLVMVLCAAGWCWNGL